jgi:hypothetical protein
MQIFSAVFLIFFLCASIVCQEQTKVSDECVVSVVTYPNAASLNSEEYEGKAKEIGKFETTVYEGELTEKRFRIPGSKLFVSATVLYDDNIYFDNQLHDAMNITLAVSQSRKFSLSSSISVATTQIQYDKYFNQVSIVVLARTGNKWFDVSMKCSKKQRL